MAFKQNNPFKESPFKSYHTANPKLVKVFGGRGTVDVSTEAGKKLYEEIKSIKTVRSSDAGRVAKAASGKVKSIIKKHAGKLLKLGVKSSIILNMFDPTSAGKGSTTLDKDRYDLMKNIED